MKTIIQQEILLMTGTTFSARQCWEKKDGSSGYSETADLQEACWNGLLPVMLPELWIQTTGNELFLWEIKETRSGIEIDLGESPVEIVKDFSIDPSAFLSVQILN